MKYSTKPRHFAPRKKRMSDKNESGHKSAGGIGLFHGEHAFSSFFSDASLGASLLALIFGSKKLVARKVQQKG
jgi:hypothetical protein